MYSTLSKKPILLASLIAICAWTAAQAQSDNAPQQQDSAPQQQGGGAGGTNGVAGAGGAGGRAGARGQRARGGRGGRGGGVVQGVYKTTIAPNWFDKNTKFWYRNALAGNTSEFILVDAEKGVRQPAFDHDKLAAALSKAAGQEYKGNKLPFTSIEFVDDNKAVKFEAANKTWKCSLDAYECVEATGSPNNSASLLPADSDDSLVAANDDDDTITTDEENSTYRGDDLSLAPYQQDTQTQGRGNGAAAGGRGGRGGGRGGRGGGGGRGGFGGAREATSPDGKWIAFLRESNVFIRPAAGGGAEVQLSTDGATNNAYGRLSWAPDSQNFVAWRIEPGDDGQVYWIESSPPDGGRAIMTHQGYPQAGDKMTAYELSLFNVESHKQTKPDIARVDFGNPTVRWTKDGHHFTYEKEDRGHTRFRVINVESHDGTFRYVIDEVPKTFIWTMNTDAFLDQMRITTYLQNTEEIIYESEQDGWRHLYLYSIPEAKLENQIDKGDFVTRGINLIDEDKRQIWFEANGMDHNIDPYYLQFYRINFDGSGLVALTEGNGSHSVTYSPDYKYLIDRYSRLDLAPVNNLRRVSDGSLVCKLEEGDMTELLATGWKPSERFVAKGRDGTTDIYGVIDRPRDLDPTKKYPILEDIYAGPQGTAGTLSPTEFSGRSGHGNYTQAGIIVVKIDGMGSANRSKAFQDVAWHNLADAGFPDRILWMTALAQKYPYMDTNRVGIYGTSAGGQNAAAAVIFHPEWYKVAVANCGCHDNRIDKSSWNEQWMGYMPHDKIWSKDPDNWFSKSSNVDNAYKLGAKLFLIVGEQDHNVPPESTFRVVNELIRAGKDFDLLVVPGADHGASSPVNGQYTSRRTQEYLVRNLTGVDTTPANTP